MEIEENLIYPFHLLSLLEGHQKVFMDLHRCPVGSDG